MPKETDKFESKLKRIEELLEKVEDSQTPLDDAISFYKDGIALVNECGGILRAYEEQVLILQKESNAFVLEPFAGA